MRVYIVYLRLITLKMERQILKLLKICLKQNIKQAEYVAYGKCHGFSLFC